MWREARWAVLEAARSDGEEMLGDSRGAQGGSRAVGVRKGAGIRVALDARRGRSGGTRRMACSVEGSALGRAGGRRGGAGRG